MKFGACPIDQSLGAIVAHGVQAQGIVLRKGDTVRPDHIAALAAANVASIVVARLEPDDVGENAAARGLAEAIAGPGLRIDRAFTGRANIFAEAAGILTVDPDAVDRINAVDESVTLATLPPFRTVETGEMVATVKIIPFAVPGRVLEAARSVARPAPLALRPFKPLRIGVVSTLLPGLKPTVIAKTLRVLEGRLAPAGAVIAAEERVPHAALALADTLWRMAPAHDMTIVYGASAIADRRDVIPAAIEAAGGTVEHFGMPVDPGNLLLVGRLAGKPVLGAPGCARSPKENGFDWVLHRLLAGLEVMPADIRRLGTGGLLMEIVSRPQPRLGESRVEENATVA
ncbi:MAG TPA: molybdopterin-binding protein [Lichenihabitans sp.]|nr:molybdopterin-binding protein [Lichenihabitans sp.]